MARHVVNIISASEILCVAANQEPVYETKTEHDTHCSFCGISLRAGAECSYFSPRSGFLDYPRLAAETDHLCGWCRSIIIPRWLREERRLIASLSGITLIRTGDQLRQLVASLPEPPFIVVYSTASPIQAQHIHWMAPVNRSRELVGIQFNHSQLWVRPRLIAGLPDLVKAERDRIGKFPFAFDRNLESSRFGEPHPSASRDLVKILARLTFGELWLVGLQSVKAKGDAQ